MNQRWRHVYLGVSLLAVPAVMVVSSNSVEAQSQGRSDSRLRGATGSAGQPYVTDAAFTKPSERIELAFDVQGQIAEVLVKEGQAVRAGEDLLRQDTSVEQAQLRALEAEADVAARVRLAELQAAQAEVEYKRMIEGNEALPGSFNPSDVERAKLEVEAAKTRIDEEKRAGRVAEARAEAQRQTISQMVLQAPTDGVVEKIEAATGEVFGPQTAAITLVRNHPAYVEIPIMPVEVVRTMQVGQSVDVRYPEEDQWRPAKVIYIAPEANTSQTQLVRLELPNAEGRNTGLRVQVRVAPAEGDAGAVPAATAADTTSATAQ